MDKKPAIALTLGLALSALLVLLTRTDRIRIGALLPEPVAPGVCVSSFFGNQCGDRDLPAIMAAAGDRAFAGRGIEAAVNFSGVRAHSLADKAMIVGTRIDADIACVTGNSDLIRAAERELNRGERARLSGIIDRRSGRTLYLSECTYLRDG